jgi:hypothetical protein
MVCVYIYSVRLGAGEEASILQDVSCSPSLSMSAVYTTERTWGDPGVLTHKADVLTNLLQAKCVSWAPS